jgi:WD40 repeat protein
MRPRLTLTSSALVLAASASLAFGADEKAKPKVTFEHVSTIFRAKCNSCHNADKQKGGLNLETYGTAMQGGAGGKVIEPGDSDGSRLFGLVSHTEEPKMPPMQPKIPDADIATIKLWIDAGAPESSGSAVAMKAKPKFEFKVDASATGKPVGPAAMPEGVPTEPAVVSSRPNAILAMSASPWAPLVAIGGHKQVLLYNTNLHRLVGVFPFPEGTIHVLKFSRNGSLLLAAGGRGGQSGGAVVYDVKNGKRVFEIVKEYDSVLAADISPDHSQIALGGPSRILRVYSTADGQPLFESKKHTEWITAIEFSPDGVLLASGDRNNGLFVWEAATGREFFELRGHTGMITDLSWRPDSNVLASCSEDGSVRLWEMENGAQIKTWGAHGGGTASVRFAKDGRLVTTGRDRLTRMWDQNGGKQRDFEAFNDLALHAVFSFDDAAVIAGDWSGEVRLWNAKDGVRLANLVANPAPVAVRLETVKAALTAAKAAADAAQKELAPLQAAVNDKAGLATKAQQALAAAQTLVAQKSAEAAALEKTLADKTTVEANAAAAIAKAQVVAKAAADAKLAAEKKVVETIAAEKATAAAFAASKTAIDKAIADKTATDTLVKTAAETVKATNDKAAADKANAALAILVAQSTERTNALTTAARQQGEARVAYETAVAAKAAAPKAVEVAAAQMKATADALPPLQAALTKAQAEKVAAATPIPAAKAAALASTNAVTPVKAAFDGATAAKVAADKALADKNAAFAPILAKAESLRLETEALASEKKAADGSKSAMTNKPPKG